MYGPHMVRIRHGMSGILRRQKGLAAPEHQVSPSDANDPRAMIASAPAIAHGHPSPSGSSSAAKRYRFPISGLRSVTARRSRPALRGHSTTKLARACTNAAASNATCARPDLYRLRESSLARLLDAKLNILRFLQQIIPTDEEGASDDVDLTAIGGGVKLGRRVPLTPTLSILAR